MCEILEYVDWNKIKSAEPKWFMGYSDNTNFTFLLNTIADTARIYGPPVSQAIELARTCQGKIAITVHDQTMLRQLRMTLRYADCLDDTIIIGLGLVEAARVASANPDLHIMGELPNLPSEIDALVNAAQTTGLFGLRAEPKDLSERLVSACRQAGLFTMSRCTDDPNTLAELIRKGVNFIETRRPDITAALLPAGEAEPHGIPLRY